MNRQAVDDLREQLRELGYLSRGLERWFALDPWSSRTFWSELLAVALKAATLIAPFAAAPLAAVTMLRNNPDTLQSALIFLLYLVAGFAVTLSLVIVTGLLLKSRAGMTIDSPGSLLPISMAPAALLLGVVVAWWSGFPAPPSRGEALLLLALLFLLFSVASIIFSAAFLAFSIHEVQRIPSLHQRSRIVPIAVAGTIVIGALFYSLSGIRQPAEPASPAQIVVEPTSVRLALIAVDGLTKELVQAREEFANRLPHRAWGPSFAGHSAAERWASIGTGTGEQQHRVRSIEGVVLAGSNTPLQTISAHDWVLRWLAPHIELGELVPLPPAVRRRDYVWEIFASRGISSLSVNWWSTDDVVSSSFRSVGQRTIFSGFPGATTPPQELARLIDSKASSILDSHIALVQPRFVTAYFPALDIVVNRLELDATERLTGSVRVLDQLAESVQSLSRSGYLVMVVGLPGEGQRGSFIVSSNFPLATEHATPFDVAPTVADLFGFPASEEMAGRSLLPGSRQNRIESFGPRNEPARQTRSNDQYYENLRSLGYIR
ncbi:MAG TPA: hypothetical protein VNM92_01985 [Thermoanaerobaculia bacterium]|nr:hypothetical protein [Thermoanaerobaculia bacterium]